MRALPEPELRGLRICLVSCYPPSNGPLSEYTGHLAREYSKCQDVARITVLADKFGEAFRPSDGKVQLVGCWKLNDPLTPLRIARRVIKLQPDVVHFNILFRQFGSNRLVNFLGLTSPAILRMLRRRVVVTLHSMAEGVDLEKVGYKDSFLNKLGYRLATKLVLWADFVTVPHRHFVQILEHNYRAKNVVYVPHGVFMPPVPRAVFSGKKLLLFGKIGPYKNPTLALEAFGQLYRKDPEVELVIAGPPHPFHQDILKTIDGGGKRSNVIFTGYVPEKKLEEVFTSSIAVLLPYTTTTWSSGTFTLASAYGRPVIASDLQDFRGLVEEGAGILLFPNGDREGLTKTMELVVNDRRIQEYLGEANLSWARKNGFDQVTKSLLRIFLSVTARQTIGLKVKRR